MLIVKRQTLRLRSCPKKGAKKQQAAAPTHDAAPRRSVPNFSSCQHLFGVSYLFTCWCVSVLLFKFFFAASSWLGGNLIDCQCCRPHQTARSSLWKNSCAQEISTCAEAFCRQIFERVNETDQPQQHLTWPSREPAGQLKKGKNKKLKGREAVSVPQPGDQSNGHSFTCQRFV